MINVQDVTHNLYTYTIVFPSTQNLKKKIKMTSEEQMLNRKVVNSLSDTQCTTYPPTPGMVYQAHFFCLLWYAGSH